MLNVTPDHLDRHHTFENYAAAKARIFENQTPKDFAVLNADDPNLVRRYGRRIRAAGLLVQPTRRSGPGRFCPGDKIGWRDDLGSATLCL